MAILSLGLVKDVALFIVLVVEDHGDDLCGVVRFCFDDIDASVSLDFLFIIFYRFLCISHLLISDPGAVLPCPSLPFDETVDDFS